MCDFSQGPWSATFNGRWYELNDANENWVADTCASSCKGNIKLGEANAHLIAAAPEMYGFIEGLHESICINGGMVVIDSESIKLLEQLLAKARGEHA